jgi:2-succinyl-6-hydroxy-2,4-cyclohexadiene-1-carboxylate synthase
VAQNVAAPFTIGSSAVTDTAYVCPDMAPALHHRSIGNGTGPRIVLAHGFTQSGACWGRMPAMLADDFEIVLVDAPGHGGSSAVTAALPESGALVGDVGGTATYLGYSMGGRMLLHLALARPAMVERLILIGATPGIEDDEERAARRVADERLADRIRRIGVERFVEEWLAQPMFTTLPHDEECLAARRNNTADGLAASLRSCGTGAQRPLWDRLAELSMPVLLLTGGRDTKFTAIAQRMAGLIGANASHLLVPDAGHAAHLEQPHATARALREWLGSRAAHGGGPGEI